MPWPLPSCDRVRVVRVAAVIDILSERRKILLPGSHSHTVTVTAASLTATASCPFPVRPQ